MDPIYRHGGNILRTDLFVVHSGYDHSPQGQQGKKARDMPLLLLDIEDRPDHPFPWFNLGMTHNHWGEFKEAIPALEKSLSLSKPHESTVRKLYAMLVNSYWQLGAKDAARANPCSGTKSSIRRCCTPIGSCGPTGSGRCSRCC